MTRINVGIRAKELPDKLLLAEHREIKRIPNQIRGKTITTQIPTAFTLGTGHVRFFYNKLGYLKRRYQELYNECQRRQFNVNNYINAWDNLPLGEYNERPQDRQIVLERIHSKGFQLRAHENPLPLPKR
jgi:hypothetical protein